MPRHAQPDRPGRWLLCSLLLGGLLLGHSARSDNTTDAPTDTELIEPAALPSDFDPSTDAASTAAQRPALTDLLAPWLAALPDQQRQAVRPVEQMLGELAQRLTDPQAQQPVTRRWLAERLHHHFRHHGLRIDRVALCRRVQGFGVYDLLEPPAFTAGSEHLVIIYVELDQFQAVQVTAPADEPMYRVELTQDISLIDPASGLAVWRHPTETITDLSRNRRQDFYVVQLVRLPATLLPGQYQLRVRVTDLANDSVARNSAAVTIQER